MLEQSLLKKAHSNMKMAYKQKIKYYGMKKPNFPYSEKQLKIGIEVEKEHTDDPKIAKAIAIAHLKEDRYYYKKLLEAGL